MTNIRGKNYSGNKLCNCICLNSYFLSIQYILDIYTKKHKILWNINGINYIGIPFMVLSQKKFGLCSRDRLKSRVEKAKKKRKKINRNKQNLGSELLKQYLLKRYQGFKYTSSICSFT